MNEEKPITQAEREYECMSPVYKQLHPSDRQAVNNIIDALYERDQQERRKNWQPPDVMEGKQCIVVKTPCDKGAIK